MGRMVLLQIINTFQVQVCKRQAAGRYLAFNFSGSANSTILVCLAKLEAKWRPKRYSVRLRIRTQQPMTLEFSQIL